MALQSLTRTGRIESEVVWWKGAKILGDAGHQPVAKLYFEIGYRSSGFPSCSLFGIAIFLESKTPPPTVVAALHDHAELLLVSLP